MPFSPPHPPVELRHQVGLLHLVLRPPGPQPGLRVLLLQVVGQHQALHALEVPQLDDGHLAQRVLPRLVPHGLVHRVHVHQVVAGRCRKKMQVLIAREIRKLEINPAKISFDFWKIAIFFLAYTVAIVTFIQNPRYRKIKSCENAHFKKKLPFCQTQ